LKAEAEFDRLRQRIGLVCAPILCVAIWWLPIAGLTGAAHHLLAVLGLVVVLWITEAIPLPVTALLGPTLCVVAGVSGVKDVFKSFADPIIFLFLGSFLLAEAMLNHGLNRRIAFYILGLRGVGESPARLLVAFGSITGFISMWVSNTATTAMMFPIGLAILREMARRHSERTGQEIDFRELKYGTGLMLMASFASSVGGLATPVGTPPNLIGIGLIEKTLNLRVTFFQWMSLGLPLAILLIAFLIFYLHRLCPAQPGLMTGSAQWLGQEKSKLGPVTRGEKNVLAAFGVTVLLWVVPGVMALIRGSNDPLYLWLTQHFPESVAALIGALLLFLLPVNLAESRFTISWREATQIDWGTILLFGGGLALGDLMFATGLAQWIGTGLAGAMNANTTLSVTILFTVVAVLVSETTSNAASATMVVPVAIAVAQAAKVSPLQPALAACLGASLGFMLPVSTPPNAIVYGSGCIPLKKMVKYGLLLDLVGAVLIVIVVTWLSPLL
jgi:sodium-dependent dicarboxylate transporter 2/3/5